MTAPSNMGNTVGASVTTAQGYSTDTSSEYWQRVSALSASPVFIVYENVPNHLLQGLRNHANPDQQIINQLAAYPKRVATA